MAAKKDYQKNGRNENDNDFGNNKRNSNITVSNQGAQVEQGTPTAAASNSAAALLSVSDDRDLKHAITAIANGVPLEDVTKKKNNGF